MSTNRLPKSTPVQMTALEAALHNAAFFAAKGDVARYRLALENVAREQGNYVPRPIPYG